MNKLDIKSKYSLPKEDKELLENMKGKYYSDNERIFFEKMAYKEMNEQPVSEYDIIMHEKDNEDKIYFVKCYSSEYEIGSGDKANRKKLDTMPTSLAEAINMDLFDLLGYHITVLEWLRKRDYSGVRYDYPWEE